MKHKSLLVIITFLVLQVSGYSQIKYESTHEGDLNSFVLDNGEMIYAIYHKADKTMVLYDADHSEWKSIPLPIPRNLYFDELKSISVTVFNTDPLIELAYSCIEYVSNNDTETTTNHVGEKHTLFILNESGSMLLEAENSDHMEIMDNFGTRKLWVYKQSGQGNDRKEHVDVYSLPDALVSDMKINQSSESEFRASGNHHEF